MLLRETVDFPMTPSLKVPYLLNRQTTFLQFYIFIFIQFCIYNSRQKAFYSYKNIIPPNEVRYKGRVNQPSGCAFRETVGFFHIPANGIRFVADTNL